jgi:hypothetical protein
MPPVIYISLFKRARLNSIASNIIGSGSVGGGGTERWELLGDNWESIERKWEQL